MSKVNINPTSIELLPDDTRVLVRSFNPDPKRWVHIINRVLAMSEEEVVQELKNTREDFGTRHKGIRKVWARRFEQIADHVPGADTLSDERKRYFGAMFCHEYSLEAAALFNPSIVPHPDQSGLKAGETRFIMSLRATGEGHISSVAFRSGVIDKDGEVSLDPASEFVTTPERVINPVFRKAMFINKLRALKMDEACLQPVLDKLGPLITLDDLKEALRTTMSCHVDPEDHDHVVNRLHWLAEANYDIEFSEDVPLSERIVFPVSTNESNGIEDARFVRFVDDDGTVTYYGTYTAYNGRMILPQLMETQDFLYFRARVLHGPAVKNKGMALFPRKISGCYAMLSRLDDENLFLMYAEDLHYWSDPVLIREPEYPWEFIKIGNCGSPLETSAGWLVITHGVGAMRQYCLGAILLDLDDPTKVIGALEEPLLKPEGDGREGYVPNVVYSCGAMIHEDRLILPYAKSDTLTTICTVDLNELLAAMT
jgi:predicted GH43/DUF377 family glycosyl hydrolase